MTLCTSLFFESQPCVRQLIKNTDTNNNIVCRELSIGDHFYLSTVTRKLRQIVLSHFISTHELGPVLMGQADPTDNQSMIPTLTGCCSVAHGCCSVAAAANPTAKCCPTVSAAAKSPF